MLKEKRDRLNVTHQTESLVAMIVNRLNVLIFALNELIKMAFFNYECLM